MTRPPEADRAARVEALVLALGRAYLGDPTSPESYGVAKAFSALESAPRPTEATEKHPVQEFIESHTPAPHPGGTMSYAGMSVRWVHCDVSDSDLTNVWVMVDAHGDCPIGVQGCHFKAFPARMSMLDIMQSKDFLDHVMWPLDAPPFTYEPARTATGKVVTSRRKVVTTHPSTTIHSSR